jgi:hypothetical protein
MIREAIIEVTKNPEEWADIDEGYLKEERKENLS